MPESSPPNPNESGRALAERRSIRWDAQIIRFPDKALWQRFKAAAFDRMSMDVCFCSTLGECWISSNKNLIGLPSMPLQLRVTPVDKCPRLPAAEVFNN